MNEAKNIEKDMINNSKGRETYAAGERRAKTRRSPSLMSSNTLQPSQVTLQLWFGLVTTLFSDISSSLFNSVYYEVKEYGTSIETEHRGRGATSESLLSCCLVMVSSGSGTFSEEYSPNH